MTPPRPVLADGFEIVVRSARAYVERTRDRQPLAALHAAEAMALTLLDGKRTTDEVGELLARAVGPRGLALLDALLGKLAPLLSVARREPHGPSLAALAAVIPPDPRDGIRRLPGPRVLHWAVTQFCPRRCAYCYTAPELGGRARDSLVTRDRLREVLDEAAVLGARLFLLGGAEPMLREDLPEIMGDAIRVGIEPLVTTKRPIGANLARRLAAAGVLHVSLSVDTLDEAESRVLIGSRAYPGQVRRSVECLVREGVAFSLQAVATSANAGALEGLAAFAAGAGAKVLQVVPFEPVRRPLTRLANEVLALPDVGKIAREVATLAKRHPSVRVELFDKSLSSRAAHHCDIGQTKMFFLPSGVVHRCYKLTDDRRLDGADLRQVSVAAAWHDPEFLKSISPAREHYAGTACSGCGRFSACHDDGRCIFQALVDHERYEAPDRQCGAPHSSMPHGAST